MRGLPAGAVVTSARLEFSVVRAPDGAVASNFEVRRVLRSWSEGKGFRFYRVADVGDVD
jgi:hypothetical protein